MIETITFLSNLRKCLTKGYHHLIWGILCSKVLPKKKSSIEVMSPHMRGHNLWKKVIYFTFKIYQSEGNLLALNDFHIFFHYWCESRKYRNHIFFDLLIKYCFLTKIQPPHMTWPLPHMRLVTLYEGVPRLIKEEITNSRDYSNIETLKHCKEVETWLCI